MDVIDEQRQESAPAQLADDTPAPPIGAAPADDLDTLLAEFDAATSKQPEPEPAAHNAAEQVSQNELDNFLAGLDTERDRISELEGELNSVRTAEIERQARQDFEGWAKQLQSKLGPNVDESFARTNLLSMAMENPALEIAWRHRHITNEQLRDADREFRQLEILYRQVQAAPDDPRKQAAIQQIEQRSWQLGYMLNSRTILNRAWNDVVKRASKVLPAIDALATADHDAVAFAVKEAHSGDIPEPPVNLGIMSDREFRDYTKKNFGF